MNEFSAANRQQQALQTGVQSSSFILNSQLADSLSLSSSSLSPLAASNLSPLQEAASLPQRSTDLGQNDGFSLQSVPYNGNNTVAALGLSNPSNALAPLATSIGISAASTPNLARSPKMPPGIIAANGLNSSGQLTLVGESQVFANIEVTINNTSGFNPNNIVRGSNVTTLNVGSLNLARTTTLYSAHVPSFDSLVNKAIGKGGFQSFNLQRRPLNTADEVQYTLESGTDGNIGRYEVSGNLTLPDGVVLSNMEIRIKAGGTLQVNGKAVLKNVKIFIEGGNANLGDLQATDSQILVAGAINMNGGARFAGKSLLATKENGIQFNGATLSTGENDYVEVIADGGSVNFNASAATRGRFRATGDFTHSSRSELAGLVRVKGKVRLDQDFKFTTVFPPNQVVVAVLDTGLAENNPDLDYGNVISAWDFEANDSNPLLLPGEGSQHGTFLAGQIAAIQNNGIGIDGITDDVLLYISRGIGAGKWHESLKDYLSWITATGQKQGLVLIGADLIQVTSSGTEEKRDELLPLEREVLVEARRMGVPIVVPMGNDGGLASALGQASQEFKNIISVGATNNGDIAPYSTPVKVTTCTIPS
jgi:hypothetical protein